MQNWFVFAWVGCARDLQPRRLAESNHAKRKTFALKNAFSRTKQKRKKAQKSWQQSNGTSAILVAARHAHREPFGHRIDPAADRGWF